MHTRCLPHAGASIAFVIALSLPGDAPAQFELFPRRPSVKQQVLQSTLAVKYISTAERPELRRIELIVFDDGSIAASRSSAPSACSRLPTATRQALSEMLASRALQQALKSGQVEGCIADQSLPDRSIVVTVGRSSYVFSVRFIPEPVRALIAALDKAFAAAECASPPAAIRPLLHQ
jgi:hypothetical protein